MNTRDLEYLTALSTYNHFGKAADACFVSQPALSMQIKKLEGFLGVKLLERTNKSVQLTAIGKTIAHQAQEILQKIDELRETAKQAKDPYSSELKIGIFPTLAPYLLPLIIKSLTEKFPKIYFYLVEEQTATLVEKLKSGLLDASILAAPLLEKSFTHQFLFEEEFLLATSSKHPLAKRKNIKHSDLLDKNLILLDEGHCMREQALSFCQLTNTTEKQNFRATSLETLRHMVAADIGITLMPALARKPHDRLAYIPFCSPKPARSIELFWRATSAKAILLEDIAQHIKKIMTKFML